MTARSRTTRLTPASTTECRTTRRRVEELEQQLELQTARISAERDEALQQLEQLGKVCHVLEGKVAEKDKRIQQLGQSTAAAERNAALQAKERELMAIQKERLTFQLERQRKDRRHSPVQTPRLSE